MADHKTHHGRNIKRLREILGIKQEALAIELGSDWNQKKISMLEAKEEIDDTLIRQVAQALKVPVDAIENFNEEATANYFNTFNDSSTNNGAVFAFDSTINPVDKWLEALEENRKLYERLLQEKDAMIARLEELVKR